MYKNNNPVSFIIPCYNCSDTVEESLFSIINLELENYEICMVDDCSSDNTVEIIEKFSKEHPNLVKIGYHQKNMGGAITRNDCFEMSKYDWIFCLDSDNVLHKSSFIKLLKDIDAESDIISFGSIRFFVSFLNFKIIYKKWVFKGKEMVFEDLRKTGAHPVSSGNLLFTRKMFKKIDGYEVDLGAYDSYAFGYKALYQGYRMKIVNNTWYYHRLSLGSYWERENSSNNNNFKKLLTRFPSKFTGKEMAEFKKGKNINKTFLNTENDFSLVKENLISALAAFFKPKIQNIISKKSKKS